MSSRDVCRIASGLVVLSIAMLGACGRGQVVKTVEIEVPVEVERTVVVPVERVVTATPEPPLTPTPEGFADFAAVPHDVLVQVCEDVKQAVQYDDAARTLTIRLAAPFGPFMQLLSNGWASPLDMDWMIEQGDWDGDCATWVDYHDPSAEESVIFNVENGTGPFRLEYWRPGEELSAVRWDDYWRTEPMWEGGPSGPALYERVIGKIVPEWGTRFAMFQAGDVDAAYVPRQYVEVVEPFVAEECDYRTGECMPVNPTGRLRLYRGMPSLTSGDFMFSMAVSEESLFIGSGQLDGAGVPPDFFADVNIRKAFAACFDYEAYIDQVERGEAIQRNGPIIAGMTGYDPQDPPPPVYDPEACAAHFKLADLDHDGIPAGEDPDDVWETGFFMMLGYLSGADQSRVAAEILKANVEAINDKFRIDLLGSTWSAYLKQLRAGMLPIYRIGWLEDYHHPHNWVQPYLSAAGAFGHSLGLPEDVQAEFDAMIAAARLLADPAEQHEAYKAIQRTAAEYQPYIWGTQPTERHWEPLWVQGWFYNPAFPCTFVYAMSETDESPHPRTFIRADVAGAETLDPAYMYDVGSSCWVWRFYDPLVHLKRDSIDEFVGQLADRWEISDDGLTYTFHIREGVTFHEGGDLDAHDATYAIWRGMLQDPAAGPQWMFWDAIFGTESVEDYAIDRANEGLGL